MGILKSYRLFLRLFITGFFASCIGILAAQVPEEAHPLDPKYIPPENSPFYVGKKKTGMAFTEYGNFAKWNITAIARGNFSLEFEREIANEITVDVGGGLTFMPDFLKWAAVNGGSPARVIKGGIGFSGIFETKYYLQQVAYFKSYVGLGVRGSHYINQFELVGLSAVLNNTSFTEDFIDFYGSFGLAHHINEHLAGEFSLSAGIRSINSFELEEINTTDPVTGDQVLIVNLLPDQRMVFTFFFSYKLGLNF